VLAGNTPVLVHNNNGGCETYYRTMSDEHYEEFTRTGRIPATTETMVSPTEAFLADYEGSLVKLTVKAGTTARLKEIGVRDTSRAMARLEPDMPTVYKGWNRDAAFFKFETSRKNPSLPGQVNIGLGKGSALDTFNDNILGHERLR
jgi:hypothetical protein